MKHCFFLVIMLITQSIYSEQFVYPVGGFDEGKQLMLIYQKSLDEVELWIWDTCHQNAIKGLSNFLTPANLRILPSGDGFSFIDKDYIKIKEFAKKSPQTLPIYEPITCFSHMNWINNNTFYFVAKQGDFFQIFQGDTQANIEQLTHELTDSIYPNKINDTLFFIQKTSDKKFQIISKLWDPQTLYSINTHHNISQKLIYESHEQLCYLFMLSETEGFYLQIPHHKNGQLSYEFSCYHLNYINNAWESNKLFDFEILSDYVTGSSRLYESIEPFLPNYTCKDFIYYVSWSQSRNTFELYRYSILDDSQSLVNEFIHRNNRQIFAPYINGNKLYCGFFTHNQISSRSIQDVFESLTPQFDLPCIDLQI